MEDLNRRKFLLASGVAATGAAAAATPTLVGALAGKTSTPSSAEPAAVVVSPSAAPPPEPVMAYVRDAASGELTVTFGVHETTYRDPALVKRLLSAAPPATDASDGGAL